MLNSPTGKQREGETKGKIRSESGIADVPVPRGVLSALRSALCTGEVPVLRMRRCGCISVQLEVCPQTRTGSR